MKNIWLYLIFLILVVTVYLLLKNTNVVEPVSVKTIDDYTATAKMVADSGSNKNDHTHKKLLKAANEIASKNPSLTVEDSLKILEWQTARGYDWSASDYDTYDVETLKALAENGDSKAMQKYGVYLLSKGELNNAEKYLWDASVRGFTQTLLDIANIYIAKSNRVKETTAEALALKQSLETRAYGYFQVALKRGDLIAKQSMQIHARKFTDEELAQVNTIADDLYKRLASERTNLSLFEFDNSSPQALSVMLKQQWNID